MVQLTFLSVPQDYIVLMTVNIELKMIWKEAVRP
jgi:hypothetical protein